MAGECPHSALLATSLRQCHDDSPLAASAHESYLKIIADLKNDLEQISCEVIMVQKECSEQDQSDETDNLGLESSLRELETQNDHLEQALKLQTQTSVAALAELQTNNESLKCQIANLESTIIEKNQIIQHLRKRMPHTQPSEIHHTDVEYAITGHHYTAELERKIQELNGKLDKSRIHEQFLAKETRKINEELNESKRKNRDLMIQAHRVSELLKYQETNRVELAAKYEALEKNYEGQAKQLRAANNQLSMLDERFHVMERRQIDNNTERNLLSEEILSLKEKYACAVGHQKSTQDQLLKIEGELCKAHDVIKEQRAIAQRNECVHNEAHRRLQETNADLKKKFADFLKDYQKLQQEHEKQKEISAQQLKLLGQFQKWKEDQVKAEENTRQHLAMYQVYIRDMLEEKKKFLDKFHDLFKYYSLLQNELERLQMCPLSRSNSNSFNTTERSIAELLKNIQQTTVRVLEQNSAFRNEDSSHLGDDVSSTYAPSEEPL